MTNSELLLLRDYLQLGNKSWCEWRLTRYEEEELFHTSRLPENSPFAGKFEETLFTTDLMQINAICLLIPSKVKDEHSLVLYCNNNTIEFLKRPEMVRYYLDNNGNEFIDAFLKRSFHKRPKDVSNYSMFGRSEFDMFSKTPVVEHIKIVAEFDNYGYLRDTILEEIIIRQRQ